MKIPIIFSTVTGNAVKLAFAAAEAVPNHIGPYNIQYILGTNDHYIKNITDDILIKFDTFIIIYWCDLGSADKDTICLLNKLKDKNLIILGSLGAPIEGEHSKKVYQRVSDLACQNNNLLAHYLCRGSIDLYRSQKKRQIPQGEKGHLSEEGYLRHLESQCHPNPHELEEAKELIKYTLGIIQA